MMAKILVIEDELKIQQIICAYLVKEGFEVIAASDGAEGLESFKISQPNLMILDLMLPLIPGEQILTTIRQTSDIPVIILSAKKAEEERIFGLNIGADDYLIKPFSPRELVARVNAHLRRMKSNPPAAISFSYNDHLLQIDLAKHQVFLKNNPVNLTPTEFKLLKFLCEAPGQVFNRSQLVEQVQGYNYNGFDRTIDSHIKNLRQKIELNPEAPNFIITVFGLGYKFGGEPDVHEPANP
ncbi:MAG TPA: DNA-binding response regulator [Firmicutes bacterium]|nr:DNA-binding response regulator [Bacillota bacterium]